MTALDVANYFLVTADDEDLITNLKVQKLVYYAQGLHLALYDEPLFDDPIEHWTHGPVVRSLYNTFEKYGATPLEIPDINLEGYSPKIKGHLDEVYEVFGQFSAIGLRNKTHNEAPWLDTSDFEVITQQAMKEYFLTQVND